jgi:hypothetical protein
MSKRIVSLAVVIAVLSLAVTLTPIRAADVTIKIEPSTLIDERLFSLRLLETMYEQWPADLRDPKQFAEAVADARFTAQRHRNHINDRNLGADLANLYGDYIASLDGYTQFLASIGKIEARAADQPNQDALASGYNAGFNGATAHSIAKNDLGMDVKHAKANPDLSGQSGSRISQSSR